MGEVIQGPIRLLKEILLNYELNQLVDVRLGDGLRYKLRRPN